MATKSMRALFIGFLAFLLALPAHAQDRTYEEGQVWAYEVENAGDENALIIQRIERAEDTPFDFDIFHVSMFVDIPMGDMEVLEVGHIPLSRQTLDSGVIAPSDRDMSTFSNWEEGYREWKSAQGGVFTIPMTEVVDMLVEIMSQHVVEPKHGASH